MDILHFGMKKPARNPAWSREELILALDLYLNSDQGPPTSSSDPRILELSRILNLLPMPDGFQDSPRYRNANGVNMKLSNFRRFDPSYIAPGRVGLSRGGKLKEAIWREFHDRKDALRAAAQQIRASALGLE